MLIKAYISKLPPLLQQEVKRHHFILQLLFRRFRSSEPEYQILPEYIKKGDWVIDIGANVGHYTFVFSKLVGPYGRVIAAEPVPDTFSLLASNMTYFPHKNVTLLNIAISDETSSAGITTPTYECGIKNYYRSHICSSRESHEFKVLCTSLDYLKIPHNIKLIKIDTEGHEINVLRGLYQLLQRDKPVLLIEGNNFHVEEYLLRLNYRFKILPNSPNRIYL